MPFKTKTISNSIKYKIISMMVLISGTSLLIGFFINGLVEIKQKKEIVLEQAQLYASLIGANANSNLLKNDSSAQNTLLSNLVTANNIKNVQVYAYDEQTNSIEFFAGYHNKNTQPLYLNINDIDYLLTPRFSDENLILCEPIYADVSVIGYICLRLSLDSLNQSITKSLYIKLSVLLTSLLIAMFLALKLQNNITLPIRQLVEQFRYVAKEKDYNVRAKPQNLVELAGLSASFNTMLDRIQANMAKQKQADREIRKLNQSLEDKISQRTYALKDANKELMDTLETLHEYQTQLVENKKMASLGDMVAGIAHEVNTPIGLGITASTLMQDRLSEIQLALTEKTLKESQLVRFLSEGQENLDIIYRNLNRSAELISSFKQLAVNQTQEKQQTFVLKHFFDDILLSLKPKLLETGHQIEIECDEDLVITTKPGTVQQILTNLIMNSLIHAFDNHQQGKITIKAKATHGELELTYADNGKGTSEQLRKKIFDPFVTTKRGAGGSGLGMHLVYNLVTQALKGKISVASELGHGIEFVITIPLGSTD